MSIFRAYDIRGIVGETLTVAITEQIGRAIGSQVIEAGESKVVVARDGRLSGPDLSAALIKGLMKAGCAVVDIGRVPTPVLYFATFDLNCGNGVMLTGSHNPADYNGLKIMIGGKTLFGDGIQALKERIDNKNFSSGTGSLSQLDLQNAYLERICSDIKPKRGFKVVVDAGNGVTGELAPRLLRALGCDVIELFCEIDGHFPNHHPDPTRPENIEDLSRVVLEHGADLGLGFDGDGDRLGVIDSEGKVLWPDRQMMLYAADILARHPAATILYDVKCSRHLGTEISKAGGKPLMWKTGHSFMKAKLNESGALLGGEMSGHIFFKERWYGFDDALYTAARLLEILAQQNAPTAELFAQLPDAVNTPELQVAFAEEGAHFAFMERFLAQVDFEGAEISRIDGVRADFPHGWGLVRPSNTTPCLVLRFEADDAAHLQTIQDMFRKQLLAIAPTLSLPF